MKISLNGLSMKMQRESERKSIYNFRFSQFRFLVFTFYLLFRVNCFHNVVLIGLFSIFRSVEFAFCRLLISTMFVLFLFFCYLVPYFMALTCYYVISSTLVLFKVHFYSKVVITEEGLVPKRFIKFL